MKSYKTFLVLNLLVAVALSSCSGLPNRGGGGGGGGGGAGGGNALVSMIVTATPSTKFSVLRFAAAVTGLSVTNSAGKTIPEIGDPQTLRSDGYRLQTDSQFISKSNITGDNYKSVTITIGNGFGPVTQGVFVNTSASTVLGCPVSAFSCADGSVTCLAGSTCLLPEGSTVVTVNVPLIFTVIAGKNIGLDVNLNLDIAMTPQKVDFTLPGAVTVSLLPRAGQAAGSLDSLEDYPGSVVSTTGGNIITAVDTQVQGQRDFTTSSATTFKDPFSTCTSASFACAAFSQTVSVDALIKDDGFTFPASEVDFLDKASNPHQVEGIVLSTNTGTAGQFQMLVVHFLGGQLSPINFINPGNILNVDYQTNNASFFIDPKNLPLNPITTGFTSATDLVVGQEVMARVLTQTGTSPTIVLHSDRVVLRYSRFNGTVNTVSGNTFTLTLATLPAYFGLTGADPIVQTTAGTTIFDGITDINGLTSGAKVSVRALYLNPNSVSPFFIAAKVRKNF